MFHAAVVETDAEARVGILVQHKRHALLRLLGEGFAQGVGNVRSVFGEADRKFLLPTGEIGTDGGPPKSWPDDTDSTDPSLK